MPITHIFFDLHGTLAEGRRVHDCYSAGLGRVLSARYGGQPEAWTQANRIIVADWDSYFVDLDLGGDDGLADMWEGYFRTTRALFRLTRIAEPPKAELLALTRELPELAIEGCDTLYPEVRDVLRQLRAAGYILGAASNAIVSQVRATLVGGGVLDEFDGPLMAADVAEQWVKDERYYQIAALRAKVPPSQCLIVDDNHDPLRGAHDAGMMTAWIARQKPNETSSADIVLRDSLAPLVDALKQLKS